MTEKKNLQLKIIFSLIGIGLLGVGLVMVDEFTASTYMLRTVLQLGAIYALAAVSMNLVNGFTGLFSLGHAGFMALGAYTFAIFTIPSESRASVYYLYGVAPWLENIEIPVILGLVLAFIVTGLFAGLIGAPVLRLKSDYLAIATLGFAEIVRIVMGSSPMNQITNGSLGLKLIPSFSSFYFPFIVVGICIAIIALIIRSSYGKSFKAIREDEIAAEAMGINLAKHKQMSFIISSAFAGVSGALMAMYLGAITSTTFNVTLTYNILLIVVIGGMGSVTGSIISAFVVIISKEWLLRFLDVEQYIGAFKVPLLRTGFRMVVFSVILMLVVLFFQRGIMGNKEFNWNFILKRLNKNKGKEDDSNE